MSAVNAFNWREYTDEEHARRGDPFKDIKRNAVISANVTEGIQKLREKKPSHGTIFGITEKRISFIAPDMIPTKGFKPGNTFGRGGMRTNSGRKLPVIDENRAVALFNEGVTKKEIAERFDVPYKSMLTFFRKKGLQNARV
jgi:hypothetical protein